jgi:hypothetical protein
MKVGVRKPSIKKSFKARTTGKAKRAVKKAVIPGYGKKGMGMVKDPKKAVYNKVYNKTTIGVNSLSKTTSPQPSSHQDNSANKSSYKNQHQNKNTPKQKKPSNGSSWFVWGGILGFFALISHNIGSFLIFGGVAAFLIWTGLKKRKSCQEDEFNKNNVHNMELVEQNLLLEDENDDVIHE